MGGGDRILQLLGRRTRIEIVLGDITEQHVDVIVNAAKSSLLGGGGVDGAIHRAAGPALLAECRGLRATMYPDGLPAGCAIDTQAYDLPARWVVHTVGPDRRQAGQDRPDLLRACYTNSLAVADLLGARTIAFPLISSGVYAWPTYDALYQAFAAIRTARTRVRIARLVIFDEETYRLARTVARVRKF